MIKLRWIIKVLILYKIAFFSLWASAAKITYIGDSHSSVAGALYPLVKASLPSNSLILTGRSVCGAHIEDYLAPGGVQGGCTYRGVTFLDVSEGRDNFEVGSGKTENILSLFKKTDTVMIQLGDNHIDDPNGAGASAKELVTKILTARKKCIWMGPASISPLATTNSEKCSLNRSKKQKVNESIKKALNATTVNGRKCIYIDSFALTDKVPPKSKDCLHYTDYLQWAESIRDELSRALAKINR